MLWIVISISPLYLYFTVYMTFYGTLIHNTLVTHMTIFLEQQIILSFFTRCIQNTQHIPLSGHVSVSEQWIRNVQTCGTQKRGQRCASLSESRHHIYHIFEFWASQLREAKVDADSVSDKPLNKTEIQKERFHIHGLIWILKSALVVSHAYYVIYSVQFPQNPVKDIENAQDVYFSTPLPSLMSS